MKKNLLLILLVFCITSIALGNYVISVKTTEIGQNLNSKTKESSEIYTSNTSLNTKEELTNNTIISMNSEEKVQNISNENLIQNANSEDENLDSIKNLSQNEIPQTNENINEITTSQVVEKEENINTVNSNVNNSDAMPRESIKSNYSFLLMPENATSSILKTAESEISRLPQNVLNSFINDGWTINITNDNIASKYFGGSYSNVMGATKMDSKQIIIQNKKSCVQASIIHEMGHFIDNYFDYPSLSDEFWEIYNSEIDTFRSRIPNSSAIRDELEFFAHTFYYSVKDPSKCTPMALQFVENYVNNM